MENLQLICMECKHFREIEGGCAAFPDGIPDEIINGENLHKKPLKDQDNNIVFEKAEDAK